MFNMVCKPRRFHEFGRILTMVAAIGGAAIANMEPGSAHAAGVYDEKLAFHEDQYKTLNVTVNGKPMQVRRYDIVYVAKPVPMAPVQPPKGIGPSGEPAAKEGTAFNDPLAYQTMVVYVPETAVNDQNTAILLQVSNAGWFASRAADTPNVEDGASYVSTSNTDVIGSALNAGYVVISAGTRSRSALAADGTWAGKAPAAVVDAKAIIRYLRLNDTRMPGSAERIVINGTSGGGALSAMIAASGNSADFAPYLAEIGAAGIDENGKSTLRDDIFATIAYCPITDLGHADLAYEWQYRGIRNRENTLQNDYSATAEAVSARLAKAYPAYLASLGLKLDNGKPLNGDTMADEILALVRKSVERAIADGLDIPPLGKNFTLENRGQKTELENTWFNVKSGKIISIDYEKYLKFVAQATPLKLVPAFDSTANTDHVGLRGESSLFGGPDVVYSNFTAYGWNHNQVKNDGSGPDDTGKSFEDYISQPDNLLARQLKLINPFAYLSTTATTAPYWYLRFGLVDRDTSFAVETALYHAVKQDKTVKDVNFALAWLKPHSGNYDVQEAHAWLATILKKAGPPAKP